MQFDSSEFVRPQTGDQQSDAICVSLWEGLSVSARGNLWQLIRFLPLINGCVCCFETLRRRAVMWIIEILRQSDAVIDRLWWVVVAFCCVPADQISHLSAKRVSRFERPETNHGPWRIEVPVIIRKPNEISDLQVGGPDAA